jgi:hypothetical protein
MSALLLDCSVSSPPSRQTYAEHQGAPRCKVGGSGSTLGSQLEIFRLGVIPKEKPCFTRSERFGAADSKASRPSAGCSGEKRARQEDAHQCVTK